MEGRPSSNNEASHTRRSGMATTERRYSKEEFARHGGTIYEKEIRPRLTRKEIGKFVAIDLSIASAADTCARKPHDCRSSPIRRRSHSLEGKRTERGAGSRGHR